MNQLIESAKSEDIEEVHRLLADGADVNYVGDDGRTALIWASYKGRLIVVKCLLKNGANVNHVGDDGRTALVWASYRGFSTIVEHLLANGANVNHADNDGRTALIWASYYDHSVVVEHLLLNGANVNHVDRNGCTVLQWARRCGYSAPVKRLIEHQLGDRNQWICDQDLAKYLPRKLRRQCSVLATMWSAHFADSPNIICALPLESLHMLLRELHRISY